MELSPEAEIIKKWSDDKLPLVSICSLTYNHEKYIRQCLDGFLMQKTTFPFELIIHDDASTDNTAIIIEEYKKRYPQIIKPIYQTENQYSKGRRPTIEYNFPRAKGKYIAMCEGDDYWTDPLKLQKQVNFLEANKHINVCFHQINYIDKDDRDLGLPDYPFDSTTSQYFIYENIIENWCINTCSVLLRNPFGKLPLSICNYKIGDQPLFYFINMGKNFYYFPDVMASYRITNTGFTSTLLKKELKSDIEFPFLDKINELSKNKYIKAIKRRKARTIIKDLKFMKNNDNYSFLKRMKFYSKNLLYLLNFQKGFKVSVYCFFKYVI